MIKGTRCPLVVDVILYKSPQDKPRWKATAITIVVKVVK